jgi:hypothetical protein
MNLLMIILRVVAVGTGYIDIGGPTVHVQAGHAGGPTSHEQVCLIGGPTAPCTEGVYSAGFHTELTEQHIFLHLG